MWFSEKIQFFYFGWYFGMFSSRWHMYCHWYQPKTVIKVHFKTDAAGLFLINSDFWPSFSPCWVLVKISQCTQFLPRNIYSTQHGVAKIFVGGAPGRQHPALHQSCTRLKLSRAAEDLWALQQSAKSWVEPQSEIKIAKNVGEMTFEGGFCKCCLPQIHWYDVHKCRRNVLHSDERTQWTVQWCSSAQMATPFHHFLHLSGCYPPFSYSTASPFSLSFCPYVCLSLSVVLHPVFLISCLSLRFGDVDVFFLQF